MTRSGRGGHIAHLNGLGELQAHLLIRIYEQHVEYAQHNFLRWQTGVDFHGCGVTRSGQAAQSRSLARLEAYGLIRRLDSVGYKAKRLTRIQIRPPGIAIAEQLTNRRGMWMLTVGTMTVPELRRMTAEEFAQAIERIRSATVPG